MSKPAANNHPINDLIAQRWSPVGFQDRSVSDADLCSLFEAVRWAPSSYNEQPWRYLVARREDKEAFDTMLSCLVEANQVWAQHAPVLALGAAMLKLERNGKPNGACLHDLGLASANLCLEATARGMHVHQMSGIRPDLARELYAVPEDAQVLTGIAIGYAGDAGLLAADITARDGNPRERKPLSSLVFTGGWGSEAEFL